jgi:hypothetical protein
MQNKTRLPSVWAGKAKVGSHITHGTGPPQSELKGEARPAGNSKGEQDKTGPRNGGHRRKAPVAAAPGPAGPRSSRVPRGAGKPRLPPRNNVTGLMNSNMHQDREHFTPLL